MASSYPLVDRSPLPAIARSNSPMELQIRGAKSAAGNRSGAVSGEGILGLEATAGKLGFGSTENLGLGSSADKLSFAGAENLGFGTRAEKLGFGGGGGGGAGGKLRSSRRAKKTPYDRPATGRHATPGGSAAMAASMASSRPTIASRLRDSASRLISSSASYFFSSLFKRGPAAIKANGESHTAGGIAVEEEKEEETMEAPAYQDDQNDVCADQDPAFDADPKPVETEETELDMVEEILKQKTWSREQVNRLTKILQTCVCENNVASPSLETRRPQEKPKKDTEDLTLVQVARAYMGEQATRPPGIAASIRSPVYQSAEVQPSPGRRLLEDRYMSSPFSRTWARSSTAVRMPKRSFVVDDDLASMGPIRRVRQKTSVLTSTRSPYLYSRQMTGSGVPSRTLASPPLTQSSQTALRILETLEKLSPSPKGKFLEAATEKSPSELRASEKLSPSLKGKFLDESRVVAGMSLSEKTPETSKAREKRVLQNPGLVVLPKSPEPSPPNGKAAFGGLASTDSEALGKSIIESPALTPGSPIIIPERTKGFRMSAVFEESNSDEESKPHAQLPTLSEARHPAGLLNVKEAASLKPIVAPLATVVPPTTADVSVSISSSLPMPFQSSVSPAHSFNFAPESNSLPVAVSPLDRCEPSTVSPVSASSEKPTSNFMSFPTFSFPSAAMETGPPLSNAPASPPAVAALVSVDRIFTVPTTSAAIPASPSILATPAEVPAWAVVSTPPGVVLSAAASESTVSAASSLAAVIPALFSDVAVIAPGSVLLPPSKMVAALEDLFEVENGVTMATESPVADKLTEVDTMATDSMAEEADTFIVAPPALAFQSGLTSTASPVSIFSFGASTMSSPSSAFSFAAGAPASSSSAATFAFGGQLGTVSAGEALSFGAMPSPPVNPFSSTLGNSSSAFMFGSSTAAASTSNVFTATPSGLPTFQFGPPATSSPLSSPFTSSGAANSFSAFAFSASPAPVSSATPTFLFGAGAASSQSSGSASAGQPFTFGAAQPNPFTANLFTSSGAPNSAPPAMAEAPSTFPFGSRGDLTASPTSLFGSNAAPNSSNTFLFASNAASDSSSTFAFGSGQLAATPALFTFGGQTAALPASGQQFGFGGEQPAMLAQHPLSAAGATQPGLDFAGGFTPGTAGGGFAPGATGGEKSGRKYIKAKRTGGAKRGK